MNSIDKNIVSPNATVSTVSGAEIVTVTQPAAMQSSGGGHLVLRDDLKDVTEEALLAQLATTDITHYEIIEFPVAGALSVHLPDPVDGDTEERELEMVILASRSDRRRYEQSIEESGGGCAPDCFAPDGIIGIGNPGHRCAECAYARFGSARNGRAQACKKITDVYHFRRGRVSPSLISLPPTSDAAYAKYDSALKAHGLPPHAVVSQLSFKPANSGAFRYAIASFKTSRRLTPEETRFMAGCANTVQRKIADMVAAQIAAASKPTVE